MMVHVVQLCGFLVVADVQQIRDPFYRVFCAVLRFSRLTPFIRWTGVSGLWVYVLVAGFLFDVYVLYCCAVLLNASIKEQDNQRKLKSNKIQLLSYFFEHFRWVYYVFKLDLVFGQLACEFRLPQSFAQSCSNFQETNSSFIALLIALQLLALVSSQRR